MVCLCTLLSLGCLKAQEVSISLGKFDSCTFLGPGPIPVRRCSLRATSRLKASFGPLGSSSLSVRMVFKKFIMSWCSALVEPFGVRKVNVWKVPVLRLRVCVLGVCGLIWV